MCGHYMEYKAIQPHIFNPFLCDCVGERVVVLPWQHKAKTNVDTTHLTGSVRCGEESGHGVMKG